MRGINSAREKARVQHRRKTTKGRDDEVEGAGSKGKGRVQAGGWSQEVDSTFLGRIHSGGRKEGEEAGEDTGVFLSRMRSDLVRLSLARPAGRHPAVSVDRTISKASRPDVGIAKHCRVMSVITPTCSPVDREGRTRAAILA